METDKIKQHFDRIAADFEAIYSGQTGPLRYVLNRVVHRDIYQRYDFVFQEVTKFKGKRVLDIGCGPGRLAIGAALRGASQVLGLDVSEEMIKIANEQAKQSKVAEKCKFVQGEFLRYQFSNYFDYTFAIGMIEYTENPTAVLRRIFRLTQDTAILTFPEKWAWREFFEKLPQYRTECQRYYYTEARIHELMGIAGFEVQKIVNQTHQFLVVASPRVKQKGIYR